MNIGKLNNRVIVLTREIVRSEFGEEIVTWIEEKRLWANIRTISGTEDFNNEHITATAEVVITIRFDPKISVLNRIQYKDKLYEIIGVYDENNEHKKTILNCKEIVTYGVQCETEEN